MKLSAFRPSKKKSSIEKPPSLEFKPLPEDLKYSSKLEFKQKEKLLQEHKNGIGWTLPDILDIIPFMCTHKILLENREKEVMQPFNPLILDVVKNDIIFMCSFDTFTYIRVHFDPRIKSKDNKKNFKVNRHRLMLLCESPTLEEEIGEELSLGKDNYTIIYSP